MPVPDNNTFSLQDVVNEVNPTTDDLQDCINDAVTALYDPTYYTSPATSLLEFRNYNSGVNLLTVQATSAGGTPVAMVANESTLNQSVTFTWQYVSQTSDISANVYYNGFPLSPGFTTPTLGGALSTNDGAFYVPFTFTGGNNAYIYIEFTLITASVDSVPSSPNNKTTVTVQINTT